MLTVEKAKERFGEAYVRAVVASARCKVGRYDDDTDSDDLLVRRPGSPRGQLFLQLKATATPLWQDGALAVDLPVKNYDDLRLSAYAPGVLVVTVLPADLGMWLSSTHQSLTVRHCSYWVALIGEPPTANTATIRVSVPKEQVFDVSQLTGILDRLESGGAP